MLNGHPMRRKGWQGRIEFVAYVPAGSVQVPQKFAAGNDTGPFLVIKRKHGPLASWTITQADLLADDWEMSDPVKPGEYHWDGKSPNAERAGAEPTQSEPARG
jgi:hypothetical protein